MPVTHSKTELRPVALERIATGQLPRLVQSRTWAGPGTGKACALCDQPIHVDEVEYEIEDRADGRVQVFRLHLTCQGVWQDVADLQGTSGGNLPLAAP
jgi:hypothetical protein